MKSMNIKVNGMYKYLPIIKVDDRILNYKYEKKEGYYVTFQSENEKVNLEIIHVNDLSHPLWILIVLFNYIISVFGIFDIRRYYNDKSFHYKGELILEDGKVLEVSVLDSNDIALSFKGEILPSINDSIKYINDEKLKRRKKSVKLIKLIPFIILIIVMIILFINT